MSLNKKIKEWTITIVMAVAISLTLRTFIAEARWIPSGSMLPTLDIGDRLLIDKLVYRFEGIHHGDIIVFKPPHQSGLHDDLIKRVIALPGDELFVKNDVVFVNGAELDEPYLQSVPDADYPGANFGPVTVPDNMIFVMGDNRHESYDSRFWGFVPEKNVIGRAIIRFYPATNLSLFTSNTD